MDKILMPNWKCKIGLHEEQYLGVDTITQTKKGRFGEIKEDFDQWHHRCIRCGKDRWAPVTIGI